MYDADLKGYFDSIPHSQLLVCLRMEERVPKDHPLRQIRPLVDEIFRTMSRDSMDSPPAPADRRSRPNGCCGRFCCRSYSVRSERMAMEQLNYNLLFRSFVGMAMDEPIWEHTVFSKNRERLLNQDVARKFFHHVLAQAQPHLSEEHFTVDPR